MSDGVGEGIQLGQQWGVVISRVVSEDGIVEIVTPQGLVTGHVYQVRDLDVPLEVVEVALIEEQVNGTGTGRYALMVDDPYWGRRIQPAQFAEPPWTEDFVMGYRLRGEVRQGDELVVTAPVSFEVTLETAEDGAVRFWDSEEYNKLIWSGELETYVSGPEVTAPVVTDWQGKWEHIVPKGHKAPYQRETDRRDDTAETAQEPLRRYVEEVQVAYRGRRAVVVEGEEALINIDSAGARITATPGATVRAGVMEDAGQMYLVPASGVVEIGGLPEGWVSLAQFQRAGTGEWDPRYGAPRVLLPVHEDQMVEVDLGELEQYPEDGTVACGRVYWSVGVPAVGVQIVIISQESGEIVGTAATTGGTGFWSVDIPAEGLGGNLFIMDPNWGSMPIYGMPYSDVVLGARAYAGWMDEFMSEAWRRESRGHKNFPYVPGATGVVDNDTGQVYETEESPYGGWMTQETLPKWKCIEDPVALLTYGPQLRSYRLETDHGVEDPDFHLRDQSFSGWDDQPSYYRAAGYYPEKKILLGGKIKYNVVVAGRERIDHQWPEAARVGLEWGKHAGFVELRAGVRELEGALHADSCCTDWLCPYCGGPVMRWEGTWWERGYCQHCADTWYLPRATDGRGFAQSVALASRLGERWEHRALTLTPQGGFANVVRYHWRPDLYEESEEYLRTDGPGMRTNAPRWWAKHPHEVLDGRGLGVWNGDVNPPYTPGRTLEEYGGTVGRALGLAQFKLAFPPEWVAGQEFALEVDCEREDEEIETVLVTVPEGTEGPNELHPLGDVIALAPMTKLRAEGLESPYETVGLYRAVRDMRLVGAAAPGSRAVVTADVPYLATPEGVEVQGLAAAFVALQLAPPECRPHIFEDAVGQLFLFRTWEGNIEMRRRRSVCLPWEAPRMIVTDGESDYPWAIKDEQGRMILVRQVSGGLTVVAHSRDEGKTWEEV